MRYYGYDDLGAPLLPSGQLAAQRVRDDLLRAVQLEGAQEGRGGIQLGLHANQLLAERVLVDLTLVKPQSQKCPPS